MNNKSLASTVFFTMHFFGLAVSVGSVFKTEICNMETLDLKCQSPDQIILVNKALYGRMERGRCMRKSYEEGCGTDATAWVEDKCAGRHVCEQISIPDPDLYNMLQCSKETSPYIQAEHQCIQVVPLDRCKMKIPIKVESNGFLSPHKAVRECIVHLVASAGQRINITLYDFGGYQLSRDIKRGGTSNVCQWYAHISETGRTGMDVCRGLQSRRSVYLSETSSVDIRMSNEANKKFLLYFELAGCGTPTVPDGVDVEVSGSQAIAVCNLTGERTHLICKGVQWVGSVNPCVLPVTDNVQSTGTLLGQRWSSPVGLVIVVALGIAIGTIVGVCALLFFAFCFVKKKNKKVPALKRPVPYDSPRGGNLVSKNYLQLSTATTDSGEPSTEIQLSKCTLKRQQNEAPHKGNESFMASLMADSDKSKCTRVEMDFTQNYETSFMAKV